MSITVLALSAPAAKMSIVMRSIQRPAAPPHDAFQYQQLAGEIEKKIAGMPRRRSE